MTDPVNVPREVLERIAAADFEGVFCYEENPQYEGANTSGHIIRYRPRQQPPAPDGSRSVKLSFPVLAAASWLDDVESVLPVFAEFLTYAPALAKDMLAAAPKAEPFGLSVGTEAWPKQSPEAPKVEQEPVGTAEVEVGRAVYLRIESLIALNPKPNTSEWSELTYLSYLTGCVEELGAFDGPTVPLAPASDELLSFPYQRTFDAIAAAATWQPTGIGISVEAFERSFNAKHKGPQS